MRWRSGRSMHVLSGAYALDAVTEPERRRFERHLAGCPSCQREVAELQETASRFAVAVSGKPPAHLKARVLEAVAEAEPLPQVPVVRPPRYSPQPGWARRLAVPLAAACLVVAVTLGVLLALARGQLGSTRTQEDEIADVLSAPGTRDISDKTTIGGLVTVDVASGLRQLVVTTFDMPALPASEAYQVWMLEPGGKAASDGMLTSIPDHRTAPVLASGVVAGDKMGVTVEPAGGTAKPTTAPIAVISLPS